MLKACDQDLCLEGLIMSFSWIFLNMLWIMRVLIMSILWNFYYVLVNKILGKPINYV